MTIYRKEHSLVNSGTDGGNSDIGVLADCSEDEEESQVEQFSGCWIPGCQCEGHIEYMEWGSEDMTDTDDSEWEDPDEREKRLYVECYNFDLFEGMTHLTYTPPTRKNRRRRYEDRGNMDQNYKNQLVVLVSWGFKLMRNRSIQNRQYNRGRLLMRISPHIGIGNIHMDPMS